MSSEYDLDVTFEEVEPDLSHLSDAELGIVLDRSAFYPGGGGQPPDHGVLLWGGVQTRIVDMRRGDDLIGMVFVNDGNAPKAFEKRQRALHGREEFPYIKMGDELCDDLCIGI